MEFIGSILEVIKCFGGPTCTYIDNHRKLEECMNDLREKVNVLNIRRGDLASKKEAELRHRRVVREEVEYWFKAVENENTEMEKIETKFSAVSYFSRARLGKLVRRKIAEVKEIHQQGNFLDGVAIDAPPTRGVKVETKDLEGEYNVKEQIWEYLMGDEVGMIGVCGMGGIGKTTIMKHINNQLLVDSHFDMVIWVTVSKELNIFKLQKDIADSLEESLPDNELQRVARLKHILEGKRYVLILDDVWKRFSLLDVGILEPTVGMGRKVVLTSRSIEVCTSMDCKVVKVKPLSKEESMNLFLDHVGHSVVQDQILKDIVNKIVEQCGGLPLSIVTIAGSMKGVDDICEWRNALIELEEHVKSVKESDIEVFERLKFSYDRLIDPNIQNCFLFCSLYPEDFVIKKVQLIEHWIDEGLLNGLETRQAMHDRGHSILNKLENNCLLERATTYLNEEGVKMHDVLRDMALYIKGHQFMAKAGMQLEELPSEQEWTVSVEKISLMENSILKVPPHIAPNCPHLSTLLLQNCRLRKIPGSFFKHLIGLKVLDLSSNIFVDLPDSISNLKNLNALILFNCLVLKCLPSLAELKALRKLDISFTSIKEVPHGIEMLENLRYLDLRAGNLKELPVGILPMISHIRCLIGDWLHLNGEEVSKLRKLEYVSCSFCDMQELKKYVESVQGKCPTNFKFGVGISFLSLLSHLDRFSPNFKDIRNQVTIVNCDMGRCDDIVVPNDLRSLSIWTCDDFKCLSDFPSFREATDLKICRICECKGIECVVDLSLSSCNALHNIEELYLHELRNLCEVVRGVAVENECTSHAPTPSAIFSSLKQFHMSFCSRVKKLFPVELLQGLQNLEKIRVQQCVQMEEITSEENHKGEGTTFVLPKLKSLELVDLPRLKSICSDGVLIITDSLQNLMIVDCPKVKRIPLSLPLLENGQPSLPPFLNTIRVRPSKSWESMKWDHPDAKDVLSPFVTYL